MCFGVCTGYIKDVSIFLWNNGFSNADYMLPGNGKNQIVDLKSSGFMKCKTHYEAAYACMKLASKSAKIFTSSPSLPGLDISSMVMVRPSIVVMPGGAWFNATSNEFEYSSLIPPAATSEKPATSTINSSTISSLSFGVVV